MFNTILELFKNNVKPVYDWKGLAQNVRKDGSVSEISVTEVDTDRETFRKRYRAVQFLSCFALVGAVISLLTFPFASTPKDFLTSVLSLFLFMLFFIRYSMLMWFCRAAWKNWSRRASRIKVDKIKYFKAVLSDPTQFLPVGLDRGI